MKVRELIEVLRGLDPDAPVWTIATPTYNLTHVELEAADIGQVDLARLLRNVPGTRAVPKLSAAANWSKPMVV